MKIPPKFIKLITVLLVIAAGCGGYYFWHRGEVSTDDAAIEGRTVVLSPKVQGYVKTLHIQDNQMVKAGDVLMEIDPTDYIIRRDRAKAALAAAKAAVNASRNNLETTTVSASSNIDASAAQVASARATWEKSLADKQRMESLFSAGACSRQQLDQAIATEKADRSALDKLQADLRSAQTAPTVIAAAKDSGEQLLAQVQQAEADLAQAETDLANTKVLAPMDGRITKRSVELGNYVQTGQQLATLVGTELWVVANFKETQLDRMRPGQPVDIRIDAFPSTMLHGKVESFQAGTGSYFSLFPAENATGNFVKTVQRVPVKIVFDNPPDATLPLGPGMSVIPTVYTGGAGVRI
ncbi:HlyD family secretion protein [Sporomusa acidovorans]|uniref:Colistin resistance protein EmrA n=1 Tax=Sporomusa acidovorans (strain ATCC 49682 / DSM 3132 / Mol) TaxID=1123286 RepID=A0ABZ3IY33_SPOA4|nr:HlyD family secretion protein [Sporomusa acidovorans]OZC15846.1 putative multidrug resistance protein EmrK [Sporomusa acidovorans DSM 3132]SDF29622.1 membrane fusion protein, multidrug efflux system [Sporomusa acidovorans]